MIRFLPLLPAVLLCTSLPSGAQDADPAGPKVVPDKGSGELDLTNFPGQVIDEVIVPVPSEIFGVLDKLGDPDWKGQISRKKRPSLTERTDVALLLGTAVADGFIAVQAQDRQTIQDIGRDVLSLATALGVRDDVLKHCQAIDDAANESQWDRVREELDATQTTVREKMNVMQDGALAECVSVGGWLRGTAVITDIIRKDWSPERAELLFQPDLTDYFNDALEEAMTRAREPEKLKLIADGLAKLHLLMENAGETISRQAVAEMHTICSELVDRITSHR